jgi:hypothetical protein
MPAYTDSIRAAARLVAREGNAYAAANTGVHRASSSPLNGDRLPTAAQAKAGNYKLGVAAWQGIQLRIENPVNSVRTGVGEDGKPWRNVMCAHYGYFSGSRGADGDPVDVFLGPNPESATAWMVNQTNAAGTWDEHKVLVGFVDERHAIDAYRLSYSPQWDRFEPPVRISATQLKWWLKYADTTIPFQLELIPQEPDMAEDQASTLTRAFWDSAAYPVAGQTLSTVLYRIRMDDGARGLVFDPMTMAELLDGCEVLKLDALVVQAGRLQQKMEALQRVMEIAGGTVKPVAMQISDPVRRMGGAHVAVIFELSDGQTITIWFHNPDMTPARIGIADDLVSWKWLLNKKDVTIVVAPESGKDLNAREVARRLMRVAEKNSAAFQRANAKRAETMGAIETLKAGIEERKVTLARLAGKIEVAKVEKEMRDQSASDAWWTSRFDAEQIRAVCESMGFKATVYGVMSKGGGGHVSVWKEGMVEAVKVGIDVDRDEKDRVAQRYKNLDTQFGSFDLKEVLRELDAAIPKAPVPVSIPDAVKSQLDLVLQPVKSLAAGLERARETDAKFGGGGRYAAEVWRNERGDEKVQAEAARIAEVLAGIPDEANRAAAAAYLEENRARPALTDAEANYFAPAPAVDPAPEVAPEPVAAPESGTVAIYLTQSGKVGLEVKRFVMRDAVTFSYNGQWGAGSGRDVEHLVEVIAQSRRDKRGMTLGGGTDITSVDVFMTAPVIGSQPAEQGPAVSDLWRKVSASDYRITDLTGSEWTVGRIGKKWLTEAGQTFATLAEAQLAVEDSIAARARTAAEEAASRADVEAKAAEAAAAPAEPAAPEVYAFANATEEAKGLFAIGAAKGGQGAYTTAVAIEKAAGDLGLVVSWAATDSLPTFDAVAEEPEKAEGEGEKAPAEGEENPAEEAKEPAEEKAPEVAEDGEEKAPADEPAADEKPAAEDDEKAPADEEKKPEAEDEKTLDSATLDRAEPTKVNKFEPGTPVVKTDGKDGVVARQEGYNVFLKGEARPCHANHLKLASGKAPETTTLDAVALDSMASERLRKGYKILGQFKEATHGKWFEYAKARASEDAWGISNGLPHVIFVGPDGDETRAALVKKTTAKVATDEGEDGKAVLETWNIRQHSGYALDDATGGLFGDGDSGYIVGTLSRNSVDLATVHLREDGMVAFKVDDQLAENSSAGSEVSGLRDVLETGWRDDWFTAMGTLADATDGMEPEVAPAAAEVEPEPVAAVEAKPAMTANEFHQGLKKALGQGGPAKPSAAAREVQGAGDMFVIKDFMPSGQKEVIRKGMRGEEADYFIDKMAEMRKVIETMPATYGQDGKGDQAIAYLHYFKGGGDWWITEKDMDGGVDQAFGLADLFGDGGELGYISIRELVQNGVELDLHWTPKTLAAIRGKAEEAAPSEEPAEPAVVEAEPAPAAEATPAPDTARTDAMATLAQITAGAHPDMLEPELVEDIERIMLAYPDDADVQAEAERALEAYSANAAAVTANLV